MAMLLRCCLGKFRYIGYWAAPVLGSTHLQLQQYLLAQSLNVIFTQKLLLLCALLHSAGIIGTVILLWSWHPEPSACLGSFYEIVVCLIHFVWITYIACMNLLEHQVSSSRFDFYSSRQGNHLTIPSISISMVARLFKNGQNCF